MSTSVIRRERLSRFVDLARVYRGWNKTELSQALGRDPTKLVPESGNPKLDLVVGLAEALDWTVGDVAESVWQNGVTGEGAHDHLDFEALNRSSIEAHRAGSWNEMLSIANAMLAKSGSGTDRALAFNRMGGAHDGLGRYASALKAWQNGLAERSVSPPVRIMLRANLANAHYTLWHLVEARAIATESIERLEEPTRVSRLERVMAALARYVRGNTFRRMIIEESDPVEELCLKARIDLEQSRDRYLALAEEFDDESYLGVANTCRGALIEVEAACGAIPPDEAIARINEGMDEVIAPEELPAGDRLESWGWWAIFGCNIALRHLEGDALHRRMAIFTNKAIEIADRLGNWSMRERAFTLEHFRRQQADLDGVRDRHWPLDDEDIRVITGTMGRFPSFREVGWQILRGANVLEDV